MDAQREREEKLSPAAIRSRMARREIGLWLSAFGWPALRVLVLGVGLGIVLLVGLSESIEPLGEAASSDDVLWLGARYGILLTIVPAIWAGLSSLAFRLARGWAVVPALTLPAYVGVACWLRRDDLRASAVALADAVNTQVDLSSLSLAQQVAMPSITAAPMDVPMLMAHAGDAFFAPPVRAAVSGLEGQVVLTLIAALVPGVLVSILALSVGYRRGWAVRHEADLERLRRAERAEVG